MTRLRAGRVAAVLLLLATVAFVVGIATERSDGHAEPAHPAAAEGAHADSGETKHEAGEAGETRSEHGEETLLGIRVESAPVLALGIAASLAVVAALLLLAKRPWVLEAAATFALVFGVLDLAEVTRKWGDETTIAALALAAALLHLASAAVLATATRRPAGSAATVG